MNRRQFNFGLMAAAGAVAFHRPASSAQPKLRVNGTAGTHASGVPNANFPAPLRVNGPRLNEHLKALSEFGKNPQGGVSRVAYSEADRQGREYVMGLMRAAKLDVHIDAAGNLVGRRAGSDGTLKPILFGSHIDSVPEGGNFD